MSQWNGFKAAVLLLGASVLANSNNDAQAIDAPLNTITVKADRLELDQRGDVQILSGNVTVTQGSVSIQGDQFRVHTLNGAIARIYAEGSPVKFQQQLSDGEVVQVESNIIDYVTSTWTVIFKGDVILQRAGSQLTGQTVEYNIRNRKTVARGNTDNAPESSTSGVAEDTRLSVTFKPY